MKIKDILVTAMGNTMRAKARSTLTVLAIFVGAFTLTLTSGIGVGINQYIDKTVAGIGADDVIMVNKPTESAKKSKDDAPLEYDPNSSDSNNATGQSTPTVTMNNADLNKIRRLEGVKEAEPYHNIKADYVQHSDGKKYTAQIGSGIPGASLQLAAGDSPDNDTSDYEVTIPVTYVDSLGFDDNNDAIGKQISLAVTDAAHTQHTVTAEIVGVSEQLIGSASGTNLVPNEALELALFDLQQTGLPEDQLNRWEWITVWFDEDLTQSQIDELKERLEDAGYKGITVRDQIDAFTDVIDVIVMVLNGFATIALIAAGFGIVNTLLMSVQERTREIGLMKAMGMRSSRVFALFSLEAVFIGFVGSLLGVSVAAIAATAINSASATMFKQLPGLTLVGFNPQGVVLTILLIMAMAFLAGTVPAARAAGKDPVDALRYE